VLKRFPVPAKARFVILGDCNDNKSSKPLERLHVRGKTVITGLLPAADSRGETWTHAFRRDDTYTRVDYVFVSPGLRSAVQGGVARIFDGDGVRAASDHRPVTLTLQFGQKK
jgi:endonuclease/exonuclease/phosphatase family metal-dependent hydrolase